MDAIVLENLLTTSHLETAGHLGNRPPFHVFRAFHGSPASQSLLCPLGLLAAIPPSHAVLIRLVVSLPSPTT